MGMLKRQERIYDDGMTDQSYKDSTDINKIIAKHARAGTLSMLAEHKGQFGDFADFDFVTAQNTIARAKSIFHGLPGEVRREFNNDPAQFFAYVNDPANKDRLEQLLPQLAQPGRQLPIPNRSAAAADNPKEKQGTETPAAPANEGESTGKENPPS